MKASGKGSVVAAKTAAENAPAKSLAQYLNDNRSQIENVKPKHLDTDRFISIVVRAVYSNPKLAQCSVKSILLAAIESGKLGLEPGGILGHAALVPYRNSRKNCYEAQFQLMYKGARLLAYNTGMFQLIDAREVYVNDEFEYSYGIDTTFRHKPAEVNRGEVRGYYAFFKLLSGGFKFEYMSQKEVTKWAERYSKSFSDPDSAWHQFPVEMGIKTVQWKVLRAAPLTVELPADPDLKTNLLPGYQVGEDTIPGEYEEVPREKPKGDEPPAEPEKKSAEEIEATRIAEEGWEEDTPTQKDLDL